MTNMFDRTSLTTLQNQHAYKEDVDVRKGEKITGGFGKTIYKAEWINQEGSPIVLLEMQGSKASEEILLYISLSHPHIINTCGLVKPSTSTINTKSVLLLQEYARDGDLGRMLSDRYFIPSESVLLEIFIQISNAMIYLTENNIIHGDLACRNVLVFKSHPEDPKKNLVKLIDFGLTRDNSIPLDVKIDIPIRYAAPEILRSNGRSDYSEKSDIFSFGALMWEACSPEKRMPYEHISDDNEVCRRKLNGEKLPRPEKCDANIWTLMLKCWNDRPEDRPTFKTIHTQLKNTQNLDTSSTTLNSNLLSSSTNKYDSGLFNSELHICPDCGSQYTDYHSHLTTCVEQEVPNYISDEQNRRASFQDHNESYNNLSRPISRESSSSSSLGINDDNFVPCEFCTNPYSICELDIHQRSCSDNPRNHQTNFPPLRSSRRSDKNRDRNKSNRTTLTPLSNSNVNTDNSSRVPSTNSRSRIDSSDSSIHPRRPFYEEPVVTARQSRIFIPEKPPQVNTIQLPCEFCEKSIDASQFAIHQKQCDENNKRRIEEERRRIENEESIREADCSFCGLKCPITELDNHQNNCELNPGTFFNKRSILSPTRSNSFHDLGNTSSILSNKLIPPSNKTNIAKSTTDVKQVKPTENTSEKPSLLRGFLGRIFSSKKKK